MYVPAPSPALEPTVIVLLVTDDGWVERQVMLNARLLIRHECFYLSVFSSCPVTQTYLGVLG